MSDPNVLVLLTDQQQAVTVDPESACQTPHIDSISREGVRFSRCYASNPICSPSRASLFTGVLPHEHGLLDITSYSDSEFRDDLPTWSQALSDAGYYSGYFGKWHVTSELWEYEDDADLGEFGYNEAELYFSDSFDDGFAAHRNARGLSDEPGRGKSDLKRSYWVSREGYDDRLLCGTHDEPEGTEERYLYDRGIEFVREATDREEPWSLVISTPGPHDPFVPPRENYDQYDLDDIPKPANFHDQMEDKPNLYRRMQAVYDDMTWDDYADAIACYYAYCSHIDDQVGRLLDVLAETGELDNTIIIYTSDHGDMVGGHRLFLKGVSPFEEVYRVPLVVRWPDAGMEDHVCEEPVQLHDLAPTLTDVARGERPGDPAALSVDDAPVPRSLDRINPKADPPAYESKSLLPFLTGDPPPEYLPEAYAEFHGNIFSYTQRVYWFDRYKYVFNTFDYDELYDLERDPAEMENLASDNEYQDVAKALSSRVWQIARETDDPIIRSGYPTQRFAPVGPNWEG